VRSLTFASSQGTAPFDTQAMDYHDGRASGRFGRLADAPVRYYVVAEGDEERVLARLGSGEKPLLLPRPDEVPAEAMVTRHIEREPPSRTPAWVLGGAAVASTIAGTALAASSAADARAARIAYGSDVTGLNNSAWNKALGANISFGGAILIGAGAAYAALR
jgi:hypothetical protein